MNPFKLRGDHTPDDIDGRLGLMSVRHAPQLKIQVQVLEVKKKGRFGRTDYLVTPIAGEGSAWVTDRYLEIQQRENEHV